MPYSRDFVISLPSIRVDWNVFVDAVVPGRCSVVGEDGTTGTSVGTNAPVAMVRVADISLSGWFIGCAESVGGDCCPDSGEGGC